MIFRLEMCVYLLILLFTSASGQDITFDHLTEENGLSSNSVISIAQDANSFMWYGTRYGLNRYDGRQFKIYRHHAGDSTGLPANIISAIYADTRKILWVGTSSGLCRYDPKKDCFERVPLTPGRPENVNDIFEDRAGRLWIASGSGLYLQADSFFHFRKFTYGEGQLAGHSAYSIFQDKQGNIWVGTSNGLSRIREAGGEFRFETFRHEEHNPASLSMNYITSLSEDLSGRIWIGTQSAGIDIYDPATNTFTHLSQPVLVHNFVRRIIRSKAGRMWVGTQEGLNVIDPVTLKATAYRHDPGNKTSISQNSVHSLFEDNSGTVWIGTYFGGVNMAPPHNTAFRIWQNGKGQSGISNDVVSNILEDGRRNLWIGTEGGGLNYYNRQTGTYTYYKHLPHDPGSIGSNLVKIVYRDSDNNIWAGTHGGGLNVMAEGTGRFKKYFYNRQNPSAVPGEITSLMEDREGRFWVGTSTGLHIMRRNGTGLFPMNDSALTGPTAHQSIRSLFQDSRGRCWVGTLRGLYMSQGGTMQPVLSSYINAVQEDSRGNIWVSLYYSGLLQYSPDLEQHTLYTEKDGLPHNNVMGLLEDEHHRLWISTGNGLSRFDPQQKTFRTYTSSDGIAGNTFNYNAFLKDSRGELYFGGFNGITSFFPDRIATNTYSAPLLFTGLQLFKDPVGINDNNGLLKEDIGYTRKLSFRHDQKVFTLEFSLLSYIKSSKNRYAYRLEGADGGWTETSSPSVTYANLPDGSYRFWVKGANNDGVWSAPVYMDIIVLPPLWRSWQAYCLYTALLGLLLFVIARYFFMPASLLKEKDLPLLPPVSDTKLPNPADSVFLEKLVQLVYEHMDDPEFGVDMLARKLAMSQPVLYKKLKTLTNRSVNDFVKSLRLNKAAELIRKREHAVYEVAYMVGYSDRKYFSREFKKQFGKTPTAYAGGQDL